MTAAGKKPGWAFWTTLVLVGVPVLYVASFGPAVWATSRNLASPSLVERAYGPVLWSMAYGPSTITRALFWWGELCIGDTTSFRVDSNYRMVFESAFDRS